MTIRRMKKEDGETVFRMMRTFYDSPALLTKSPDAVLRRDIDDAVSDTCPHLDGFVFEEDGVLVGYAMTTRCYTTEYGGIVVWIEDLYVAPDYRRRGIGRAFFAMLEREYPEAVRFKLEVEKENEPAVALYEAAGFAVSDYFVMTKEIVG